MSQPVVRREELQATIEARRELGEELEPALIDSFVERIEARLAERTSVSERALKQKQDHQKEMVLGAMGISIPLLALAAIFTGLAGVIVVCAAVAVIAVATTRYRRAALATRGDLPGLAARPRPRRRRIRDDRRGGLLVLVVLAPLPAVAAHRMTAHRRSSGPSVHEPAGRGRA